MTREYGFEIVGGQEAGDLPLYPFGPHDRLDSHHFVAWERRRWLNSDMRLRGTPECRALYLDLIWIAYDQSPIGTLPDDRAVLARLLMVDRDHFEALCRLPFGPLHNWQRCECEGGEIRLFHGMVLHTLTDAISRREDNRAKMEAANNQKRLQRLRGALAGYNAELAKNDAAVLWMDEWLQKQGCQYRSSTWLERALQEWSNHMLDLNMRRRGGRT